MSAQPALAPYARQTSVSNKSRIAIFNGAKSVICEVGNYQSNIAEIALRAQVSKATIYNQDPSISGRLLRGHVVYDLVPINVEGNLLGLAHDYVIEQLTALNPGVIFTKINLA